MRKDGRGSRRIREPRYMMDFCPASYGSIMFEMGNTRVICAASLSMDVPEHAEKKGRGWITAEYSLLPYSTTGRTDRPLSRRDGRAIEIQRLIARSLRAAVDLSKMKGFQITLDCDVLQADGGTRAAAITGGYIALNRAINRMKAEGLLSSDPITSRISAISVGYVEGELLLDLDFSEDSRASVDCNVVMNEKGELIEVQSSAEKQAFSRKQLTDMISLASEGIEQLMSYQNEFNK
jgi:ribonuclease PH